jgi:predicted O-methyltransferase YrrM
VVFQKKIAAVQKQFWIRFKKMFSRFKLTAWKTLLTASDRSEIRKANAIATHLTEQEKYILLKLARNVPVEGIAVEIGSYLGSSSCFLAIGLRKRSGRLYCVDTWQNESMTEGWRDTFAEFSKNTEPYRGIIIPMRGRSEVLGREFKENISLLFLDGDHSYEAVSRDFFTWLPQLSNQSVVVVHDCGWAEGVKRLIAEDVRTRVSEWREVANMAWGRLNKDR